MPTSSPIDSAMKSMRCFRKCLPRTPRCTGFTRHSTSAPGLPLTSPRAGGPPCSASSSMGSNSIRASKDLPHRTVRDDDTAHAPGMFFDDDKTEAPKERQRRAADIRRQDGNPARSGGIEDVVHQQRTDTAACNGARYEEVIDVAGRLQIGISHDRAAVVLHDERCKCAYAFDPFIAVERCRRPGLDLFGRVIAARDVVYGGMKDIAQRQFIASAELSYAHELFVR